HRYGESMRSARSLTRNQLTPPAAAVGPSPSAPASSPHRTGRWTTPSPWPSPPSRAARDYCECTRSSVAAWPARSRCGRSRRRAAKNDSGLRRTDARVRLARLSGPPPPFALRRWHAGFRPPAVPHPFAAPIPHSLSSQTSAESMPPAVQLVRQLLLLLKEQDRQVSRLISYRQFV